MKRGKLHACSIRSLISCFDVWADAPDAGSPAGLGKTSDCKPLAASCYPAIVSIQPSDVVVRRKWREIIGSSSIVCHFLESMSPNDIAGTGE